MTNQLFAAALGIAAPWFVQTVDFDEGQRRLTIHVDFRSTDSEVVLNIGPGHKAF